MRVRPLRRGALSGKSECLMNSVGRSPVWGVGRLRYAYGVMGRTHATARESDIARGVYLLRVNEKAETPRHTRHPRHPALWPVARCAHCAVVWTGGRHETRGQRESDTSLRRAVSPWECWGWLSRCDLTFERKSQNERAERFANSPDPAEAKKNIE